MFSKFLHRPALAIVISIIILFLGGLSIKTLPISQRWRFGLGAASMATYAA